MEGHEVSLKEKLASDNTYAEMTELSINERRFHHLRKTYIKNLKYDKPEELTS